MYSEGSTYLGGREKSCTNQFLQVETNKGYEEFMIGFSYSKKLSGNNLCLPA